MNNIIDAYESQENGADQWRKERQVEQAQELQAKLVRYRELYRDWQLGHVYDTHSAVEDHSELHSLCFELFHEAGWAEKLHNVEEAVDADIGLTNAREGGPF